jgi:hypothetical protein
VGGACVLYTHLCTVHYIFMYTCMYGMLQKNEKEMGGGGGDGGGDV